MILLDTNVISEMMKPEPNPSFLNWLNQQHSNWLYLSSVTVAELWFGIAALPNGKRKKILSQMLEGILALFKHRILDFDTEAAKHYANLACTARSRGKGFPTRFKRIKIKNTLLSNQ